MKIKRKRYSFIHHVIYNTSYRVPQYGVMIFDNKEKY